MQPFNQGNIKKRNSVLVFLKGAAAPIVLYTENPVSLYEELAGILKKNPAPFLIEKSTMGPVKKICFNSSEMTAIALQEEQYV